ncbi:MAG: 16S rRNA (cytosine(1402)-N(4))-methyltransferase RsmH [bacterium]|nr:16S rRNA (cytosine(1402)-N(4))-methyltransferase RsmH [bacterium]
MTNKLTKLTANEAGHVPVLLKEVIQYLDPKKGEDFIDATFGEGGHAKEILKLISPEGKLLGIDLDFESGPKLDSGSANLKASEPLVPRSSLSEVGLSWSGIELRSGNFADIANISSRLNLDEVDGVLFDFGFRSFHIDASGRGFSYAKDEPLDMRYDTETSLTALEVLNSWPENELERIFEEYGEERDSRKIAKAIAESRKDKKILTTGELVTVIDSVIRGYKVKTYSRIFQALRIAVNNELENIKQGLEGAWSILKPNGRIVAISFHSLEDRIVKNFFNEKKQSGVGEVLTKKPIIASEDELKENARSKSAKLRAIKKIETSI